MIDLKNVVLADLPEELWNGIRAQIRQCVVGLVGLRMCDGEPCCELLGSGTLVEINGSFAILTASHVTDSPAFRRSELLGLVVSRDAHRLTYKKDEVHVVTVGARGSDDIGPDIAVIRLLETDKTGLLKARRQFWSLSFRQKEAMSLQSDDKSSVWIVVGCVNEWTGPAEPSSGFTEVLGVREIYYHSILDKEWSLGEYDYLDIIATYHESADLPSSFGGVSGGGVWYVTFRYEDDKVVASFPILVGVAFHQSPIERDSRIVRCHGRKSIYEVLPSVLQADK